mgnify:CR=1 FL=1
MAGLLRRNKNLICIMLALSIVFLCTKPTALRSVSRIHMNIDGESSGAQAGAEASSLLTACTLPVLPTQYIRETDGIHSGSAIYRKENSDTSGLKLRPVLRLLFAVLLLLSGLYLSALSSGILFFESDTASRRSILNFIHNTDGRK